MIVTVKTTTKDTLILTMENHFSPLLKIMFDQPIRRADDKYL
jgi:hypothetical protein